MHHRTNRRLPAPLLAVAWPLLVGCRDVTEASAPPAKTGSDARADVLLVASIVRTLDPKAPLAHAVAIAGNQIVGVGEERDLSGLIDAKTRRIVLPPGSCLFPGFIESHAHLLGLGHALMRLDLNGTKSFEEVVERTRARAKTTREGRWILGRGWDQNRWPVTDFPNHRALSAAVPDRAVVLERVDGHAILVNARTLALAGIGAQTVSPSGGEILKDESGEPTGVLIDAAADLVQRVIPPSTPDEDEAAVGRAMAECREQGITSFHDAGEGRAELEVLQRMAQEHRLTLRVYAMVSGADGKLVAEWFERGPLIGAGDGFLTVRSVKLYADGALGSRGAALLEDYSDRPGHRGLFQIDAASLASVSKRALDAGFQICTHAIGDAGNRRTLDAYAAALDEWSRAHPGASRPDHRFRVEHAQILAPSDVPRFRELGVIASMQTRHATSDGPWVPARLGKERATAEAYVWRSLIDAGALVCNGTDAPVEPVSPLRNLYAAVTRLDEEGLLEAPFLPEQRMTREEALATATAAGAFAEFAEQRKGCIARGFLADLVATSVDPVVCQPGALLKASVLMTMVDGVVVHDFSGAAGAYQVRNEGIRAVGR